MPDVTSISKYFVLVSDTTSPQWTVTVSIGSVFTVSRPRSSCLISHVMRSPVFSIDDVGLVARMRERRARRQQKHGESESLHLLDFGVSQIRRL